LGSYDRVVLCPPTQDPDATTDLRVSADDRVELPALSLSREYHSYLHHMRSLLSFMSTSSDAPRRGSDRLCTSSQIHTLGVMGPT